MLQVCHYVKHFSQLYTISRFLGRFAACPSQFSSYSFLVYFVFCTRASLCSDHFRYGSLHFGFLCPSLLTHPRSCCHHLPSFLWLHILARSRAAHPATPPHSPPAVDVIGVHSFHPCLPSNAHLFLSAALRSTPLLRIRPPSPPRHILYYLLFFSTPSALLSHRRFQTRTLPLRAVFYLSSSFVSVLFINCCRDN